MHESIFLVAMLTLLSLSIWGIVYGWYLCLLENGKDESG